MTASRPCNGSSGQPAADDWLCAPQVHWALDRAVMSRALDIGRGQTEGKNLAQSITLLNANPGHFSNLSNKMGAKGLVPTDHACGKPLPLHNGISTLASHANPAIAGRRRGSTDCRTLHCRTGRPPLPPVVAAQCDSHFGKFGVAPTCSEC